MCNGCKQMRMSTEEILVSQFNKIPEEERARVAEISERNRDRINWSYTDLQYLFTIWNTYIAPEEPQDMTCPGCRVKVVRTLRTMALKAAAHASKE